MAALKALFSRPVVLLVAVIAVFALGYSMVRGSATGGAVAAASGGYTYDVPKGWDHRSPCHTIPLHQAGLADDGCTKPDLNADAGGYLMSMAVEPGRTGADVASALATSVTGYELCTSQVSDGACLRNAAHHDQKGELRVRVFKTLAVVVLCLRTDRSAIVRGCDVVWNHVHVTS